MATVITAHTCLCGLLHRLTAHNCCVLLAPVLSQITGIDVTTFQQDANALPLRLYKMPYVDGMIHLPAPTHQDFVIVSPVPARPGLLPNGSRTAPLCVRGGAS